MPSPANRLVIALAQIPAIVGDIDGNLSRLRGARRGGRLRRRHRDVAGALPLRLSARGSGAQARLPGGLPRGLRGRWRARRPTAARRCWSACPGSRTASSTTRSRCSTAAGSRRCASRSICRITASSTKSACSRRARRRGRSSFRGVRIGVPICEDIWGPEPVECITETGGEILLVPNASPYERGKVAIRQSRGRARRRERPAADLSQPGRRAGRTRVRRRLVRAQRRPRLAVQLPAFRPWSRARYGSAATKGWRCVEGARAAVEEGDEADYAACVLGLRDYVDNNRFPGVVLGLSGGVNSALCAAMAVDALGAARVHASCCPIASPRTNR